MSSSGLYENEPKFGEALDEKQLLEFAFGALRRSKDWFGKIWDEADAMWDMMAGESFTALDKQYLVETGRPVIDPAFAAGIVRTVVGAEMGQQSEVVFRGVDEGLEDEVIGTWLTNLVRHGMGQTNGHREMMSAFQDMLVTGYGFALTYLDVSVIPQRFKTEALNYWNTWPDPDAVKQNQADANFWGIETKWRPQDAVARWPEKKAELEKAAGSSAMPTPLPLSSTVGGTRRGSVSARQGVVITEFHYRLAKPKAVWVDPEDPQGKQKKTNREEYDARKKELEERAAAETKAYEEAVAEWMTAAELDPTMNLPAPEPPPPPVLLDDAQAHFFNGHCYYRCYFAGEDIKDGALLEREELEIEEFPVKALTGFPWKQRREERIRFYGMLRDLYDIQITTSRMIQLYLDSLARRVKGGGIAEESAFVGGRDGYEKFVKNSSISGMWHMVADGSVAGGRIREFSALQQEPGIQEAYRTFLEMFGLVSGVTQMLQGTFTGDRANTLVSNLQEQGLQMLLPIRAPRTEFVMAVGRLFAKLCIQYLPAEELDKILGVQKVEGLTVQKVLNPETGEEEEVPIQSSEIGPDGQPLPMTAGRILKQVDPFDYSVTVDVGVATPTQRQATFQYFSQHGLFKELMDAGVPPEILVPRMLENSPLPGTVAKQMADELRKFYEQQKKQGTEQGILEAFQQMVGTDFESAQALLDQIMQIAGGGQQQGQPS